MDRIDLNCDLGESFGAYRIGLDEEVVPHVTSVNIACGWHAGDPLVMEKTVAIAKSTMWLWEPTRAFPICWASAAGKSRLPPTKSMPM